MTFNIPEENRYDYANRRVSQLRKTMLVIVLLITILLLSQLSIDKIKAETFIPIALLLSLIHI